MKRPLASVLIEGLHHKLGVANCAQLIPRIVNEFLALTDLPGSILPPVRPCFADADWPLRPGQGPV